MNYVYTSPHANAPVTPGSVSQASLSPVFGRHQVAQSNKMEANIAPGICQVRKGRPGDAQVTGAQLSTLRFAVCVRV